MADDRAHVLIVVESRHGATREISGVLAQRLVTHGASVTVASPDDCHEIDADAVVVGSGVYYGKWLKSAQRFVDAHAADLASRPVWLFSSGPLGDDTDIAVEGADAGIEADVVAHLIELSGARAHHVFAGRLDRDDLGPIEKLVAAGVHAPEGDFRDWQDVQDWADEIAAGGVPVNERQLLQVGSGRGFIAALDQSGGSAPGALARYGVDVQPGTDDERVFDLMHEMRTRIISSPSFTSDRVLAAILFAGTLDREVDGQPTADHLWNVKGIVPFLKIDVGLAEPQGGVRLMQPIPNLPAVLDRAATGGVFGTKMRSVVDGGDTTSIRSIVEQQFSVAREVLEAGLVPIIEPEVSIDHPDKQVAEQTLRALVAEELDSLAPERQVMLKLTLPTVDGLYDDFVAHPRVLRVAALSGGYERSDATSRLARNRGVIASFSRALTEGLDVDQSDDEFDAQLDASITAIFEASIT